MKRKVVIWSKLPGDNSSWFEIGRYFTHIAAFKEVQRMRHEDSKAGAYLIYRISIED